MLQQDNNAILHSFIEFTTDIQHLPGKYNVVTDCPSRSTVNAVSLGIDYTAMAASQTEDEDVQAYPTAITNLQLKNMPVYPNCHELLCDISSVLPRPVVPSAFRRQVFDIMHTLAHPGKKTTQELISGKSVWHGLNKQVNQGKAMLSLPTVYNTETHPCTTRDI